MKWTFLLVSLMTASKEKGLLKIMGLMSEPIQLHKKWGGQRKQGRRKKQRDKKENKAQKNTEDRGHKKKIRHDDLMQA